MEWVHCNCCNKQPSDSKKFCLTNCGHLFCEDCVVRDKEPCKVCGQICTVLVLTSPLKPEVAMYFTEPYQLLQQYFKEFTKIMEFQKLHGKKLITGFKSRICDLNEKHQEALKKIGNLENENANLKQENAYLRETLNNSPFRGIPLHESNGVKCPPSDHLTMRSSVSTCSSNESVLMRTPTITMGNATPDNQHQIRSSVTTTPMTSSVTSTPMTSKRLSIHPPQRAALLSGNISGSMFCKRSEESQTLRMLSQSPAFSSSVSNKRDATSTTSTAGHNQTTPSSSRPPMTARNSYLSTPGLRRPSGHLSGCVTPTSGCNRYNVPKKQGTPNSLEERSPCALRRPISLKS